MIHKSVAISENAKIGEGVEMGAYVIIEGDAEIGAGTRIMSGARICAGTRIGKNCKIGSFCVIGEEPQDLHFDSSIVSGVEIGDNVNIRELSTVHRATKPNSFTRVGNNCFIMASTHIGHDCVLEDSVIMAPFAALGGYVDVSQHAFISGGVMVHQHVRIGEGVMISGNSAVSEDMAPFTMAQGRNSMGGLNLVGMNRRKISRESITNVKRLYMRVFSTGLTESPRKNALKALEEGAATTPEGQIFLNFFLPEGRRFLRPRGRPL